MPYGAGIVQYPAQSVVIKSVEEARAVIESLTRFVKAVEER